MFPHLSKKLAICNWGELHRLPPQVVLIASGDMPGYEQFFEYAKPLYLRTEENTLEPFLQNLTKHVRLAYKNQIAAIIPKPSPVNLEIQAQNTTADVHTLPLRILISRIISASYCVFVWSPEDFRWPQARLAMDALRQFIRLINTYRKAASLSIEKEDSPGIYIRQSYGRKI